MIRRHMILAASALLTLTASPAFGRSNHHHHRHAHPHHHSVHIATVRPSPVSVTPCDYVAHGSCGAGEPAGEAFEGRPYRGGKSWELTHGGGYVGNLTTVATAAGPITVNSGIAGRMRGFIGDVVNRGYHGYVHCYAPTGHVRMSTHHSGGGCDFAQTGRNRTQRVMYRVADLADKWGLRDGCSFRDCGHIDGGSAYNAPAVGGRRYAARHHRHTRYAAAR